MAENSPAYDRVYKRWERNGRTDFTKNPDFLLEVRQEIAKEIEIPNTIIKLPKGIIPNEVAQEILRSGLIIVGGKGCGKSNATKVIMAKILRKEILGDMIFRCKFYDTCQNWRYNFESIPFMEIVNEQDVYNYLREGIINNVILYDFEIDDVDSIMRMIGESIRYDFWTNRTMKKLGEGKISYWDIYVIEEAQNILGSYSLNQTRGKFWLKAISESRNFGMTFLFIGQRLADISTKVTERAQGYLFGRTSGDNDKSKIRRICGKRIDIHNEVSHLEVGQFIYWNGDKAWEIEFDLYKSLGKPFQIGVNENGG